MDSKDKPKEMKKCLDSQLWHACAGGMVQMPSVNSKAFYFPQGRKHACGSVDFRHCPRIPAYVLCRVAAVKFIVDPKTDEVFAKIKLIPVNNNDHDFEEEGIIGINGNGTREKPVSFAKTLTQHVYRGTPRRYLLTTGWSTFVNHKKLVPADSIIFFRVENGDHCIAFLREHESKLMRNGNNNGVGSNCNLMGKRKVRPEKVIEAATRAYNGQQFEVVYYPWASTSEFCVKASLVKAALQIRWCSGMRFKMAFETDDSSRISWFMGTISSVHVVDPFRWPDSPWRLLQVTWDEPNFLQNVKRDGFKHTCLERNPVPEQSKNKDRTKARLRTNYGPLGHSGSSEQSVVLQDIVVLRDKYSVPLEGIIRVVVTT
ncbi:Auxin response factor 10 [Hibiscus syriacus]|uniref:Auxin response factor 10 n=1 Tax=Hibiscus syriacus TaxID=106335 RepID=A0A6A3CAA3_HIBSY|nr:Auxin response factor 10 [Hibiscus syriacus]